MTKLPLALVVESVAYWQRQLKLAQMHHAQAVRRYCAPEVIERLHQAALDAEEKYNRANAQYQEYFNGQENS